MPSTRMTRGWESAKSANLKVVRAWSRAGQNGRANEYLVLSATNDVRSCAPAPAPPASGTSLA
jgi:hypothetical protein